MKKIILTVAIAGLGLTAMAQNVGVGTTNPQNKLHVVGDVRIETIDAGADADKLLVADADGVVKDSGITKAELAAAMTAANAADAKLGVNDEPWYGKDDNDGATSNTEAIYTMGTVGVQVADPKGILHLRQRDAGANSSGDGASLVIGGMAGTHLEIDDNEIAAMNSETTDAGNLYINYKNLQFNYWNAAAGAGTTQMYLKEGGNVGIATSNPIARLHVEGAGFFNGNVRIEREGADHTFLNLGSDVSIFTDDTANNFYGGGLVIRVDDSNAPNGIYRNAIQIAKDANVGIGVKPTAKLDVAGAIKIGNAAAAPTAGMIKYDGGHFYGYNGNAWVQLDN